MRRACYEKPCDYRLFVWIASIRRASFDQVFQFGSAGDLEQARAQQAARAEGGGEDASGVVYIKDLEGIRTYVAVDGGMSDNPRPVLYGSGYETFLPRAVAAERRRPVRVVGKHCESGDLLVREGWVPDDLAVGDVLATPVTGAYGHSMGSNYNQVLRPAGVFVADGVATRVVRRETYEDLVRREA